MTPEQVLKMRQFFGLQEEQQTTSTNQESQADAGVYDLISEYLNKEKDKDAASQGGLSSIENQSNVNSEHLAYLEKRVTAEKAQRQKMEAALMQLERQAKAILEDRQAVEKENNFRDLMMDVMRTTNN